jgi:hypothetical protein
MTTKSILLIAVLLLVVGAGCKSGPSLTPNSDPALRKTNEEFAADAKKRHPYPADVPRGGEAVSRAQVGYDRNVIDVANLSNEDWKHVDVWVNRTHVVHVPRIERGRLRTLNFKMFYDTKGRSLPTSGTTVDTVEILRDGTLYDVPVRLAE